MDRILSGVQDFGNLQLALPCLNFSCHFFLKNYLYAPCCPSVTAEASIIGICVSGNWLFYAGLRQCKAQHEYAGSLATWQYVLKWRFWGWICKPGMVRQKSLLATVDEFAFKLYFQAEFGDAGREEVGQHANGGNSWWWMSLLPVLPLVTDLFTEALSWCLKAHFIMVFRVIRKCVQRSSGNGPVSHVLEREMKITSHKKPISVYWPFFLHLPDAQILWCLLELLWALK